MIGDEKNGFTFLVQLTLKYVVLQFQPKSVQCGDASIYREIVVIRYVLLSSSRRSSSTLKCIYIYMYARTVLVVTVRSTNHRDNLSLFNKVELLTNGA